MKWAADVVQKNGYKNCRYYKDFDDASIQTLCMDLKAALKNNDFILLKGSHGIGLERIVSLLQK